MIEEAKAELDIQIEFAATVRDSYLLTDQEAYQTWDYVIDGLLAQKDEIARKIREDEETQAAIALFNKVADEDYCRSPMFARHAWAFNSCRYPLLGESEQIAEWLGDPQTVGQAVAVAHGDDDLGRHVIISGGEILEL